MSAPVETVGSFLNYAWVILLALALIVLHAIVSTVAGTVVREAMLPITIRALCAWVDLYTRGFDEDECEIRRADFRRYLWWDRYRRLRRKGVTPPGIAVHLIRLLVPTTTHDAVEAISSYVIREMAPTMRRRARAVRWTAFAWLGEPCERVRLRHAFALLAREYGYFTNGDRDNLLCCKNCQSARVPDSATGAVFWDIQRDDAFEDEGGCIVDDCSYWLRSTLWLPWDGDAELIIDTLRDSGLHVHWSGLDTECIQVLPSRASEFSCHDDECVERWQRSAASRWILRAPVDLQLRTG